MAVELLRESGALDRILGDDITGAIDRSRDWASMPRLDQGQWKPRAPGQPMAPVDKLLPYYQAKLAGYRGGQ